MEANETKSRIVTLTDQPPVKIREADWPTIAAADWIDHDNRYEFQANRKWKLWIKVRRHADGRTLVYGGYLYDTCFQGERDIVEKRGTLLDAGGDVIGAIREVGADLGQVCETAAEHERSVVQQCIASLPAEDI